jgi:hypothetical protein
VLVRHCCPRTIRIVVGPVSGAVGGIWLAVRPTVRPAAGRHGEQAARQVAIAEVGDEHPQLPLQLAQCGSLAPALLARGQVGVGTVEVGSGQLTVDEGGEMGSKVRHDSPACLVRRR